jgi:hypothetical protein
MTMRIIHPLLHPVLETILQHGIPTSTKEMIQITIDDMDTSERVIDRHHAARMPIALKNPLNSYMQLSG